MLDVFEHTDHCAGEEEFVFIVHRHNDEKFGMPWLGEEALAKRETFLVEIFGITRRSGVAHMRELVSFRRRRMRDVVEQRGWDGAVKNKIAIEKLDFFDGFPSSYGRSRLLLRMFLILLFLIFLLEGRLLMWIGTIGGIWLEDRSVVVVVIPASTRSRVWVESVVALWVG